MSKSNGSPHWFINLDEPFFIARHVIVEPYVKVPNIGYVLSQMWIWYQNDLFRVTNSNMSKSLLQNIPLVTLTYNDLTINCGNTSYMDAFYFFIFTNRHCIMVKTNNCDYNPWSDMVRIPTLIIFYFFVTMNVVLIIWYTY